MLDLDLGAYFVLTGVAWEEGGNQEGNLVVGIEVVGC